MERRGVKPTKVRKKKKKKRLKACGNNEKGREDVKSPDMKEEKAEGHLVLGKILMAGGYRIKRKRERRAERKIGREPL